MKLKEIFKFILVWCINNIFFIYPALMTAGAWGILIFEKVEESVSWITIVLVVALSIQSVIIIITSIWKRCSYKSYTYPRKMLKYGVIFLEKTITVRLCRGNSIEYINTWKIKAKSDDPQITIKYNWSGDGEPNFKPLEGLNCVTPLRTIGRGNTVFLIPDKSIKKGDEHTIKFSLKVDKGDSGAPFVSTTVYEPTKKVVFNLDFNRAYKNKKVELKTFRSGDNTEVRHMIDYKLLNFDENGRLENVKISPQRFRLFMLEWKK